MLVLFCVQILSPFCVGFVQISEILHRSSIAIFLACFRSHASCSLHVVPTAGFSGRNRDWMLYLIQKLEQLQNAGPLWTTSLTCVKTFWRTRHNAIANRVVSSCTGTQEPIQKTKQYTTANQWLLNKERTMVIPLFTGTPDRTHNRHLCDPMRYK